MLPRSSLVQGFLATGPSSTALPHPAIPERVQCIVRAALRHAWNMVRANAAVGELETAAEPELTVTLQMMLNHLLDDDTEPVPGFSANEFEIVERGAESVNYNGTRLEKRPDLRFRLHSPAPRIRDRTHYGIFVECKIVDNKHPVRRYVMEGVQRFIDGDYAWAMPHGMMVAYMRDTNANLNEVVALLNNAGSLYAVTEVELSTLPAESAPTLRSVHSRSWRYLASPNPPGPIELVHVWLSLN
jgi:hypothetical protein